MSQSEDETGSGRASADKTRFAAAARGQSAPTQPRMEGRRAARPGMAGRMTVRLEPGDCLEVIPRLVAEGVVVDAVVTDPPYGLEFMGKDWDAPWKYGMQSYGFKDG